MNVDQIEDSYRQGDCSRVDVLNHLLEAKASTLRWAAGRYSTHFRVSMEEAHSDVTTALWRLVETWDPSRGRLAPRLQSLWARSLDVGREVYGWHRRGTDNRWEAPDCYTEDIYGTDLPAPEVEQYPTMDDRDLWDLIPGSDKIKRELLEIALAYGSTAVAVRHLKAQGEDAKEVEKNSLALRKRIRCMIMERYPQLARKKEDIVSDVETQTPEEIAPVPPQVPAKKGKKGNGAAQPTPEPTSEAGTPQVAEGPDPSDVKALCDEIQQIARDDEVTKIQRTYDVGERLCALKDLVGHGRFGAIIKERLTDVAGKPMSGSWASKAMAYYHFFRGDRETAGRVGIRKMELLRKLPEKQAQEIVSNGMKKKDGTFVPVERVTVEQLGKKVEQALTAERKDNPSYTVQNVSIKRLRTVVKAVEAFIEEFGETLGSKEDFDGEQKPTLKALINRLTAARNDIASLWTTGKVKEKIPAAEDTN